MIAFLDFEASSLGKYGYPIEVAWVFEDGASEAHLIRPPADWVDWDVRAEAIHNIPRENLLRDGVPHDVVARRMMEVLAGHDLTASAPSWDGKWLSALLRKAGLPRHALRLRDTEDAQRDTARAILRERMAADRLEAEIAGLIERVAAAAPDGPPAHRALADAEAERARRIAVREAARAIS